MNFNQEKIDQLELILTQLADIEPIEKRPVGFFYRLTVIFLAILMVTLPAIYVSIVLGFGWSLVHYYFVLIPKMKIGGFFGALFIMAVPGIIGLILLVFMLKPLIAREKEMYAPYSLNPDHEPYFFRFVEEIARIAGAPIPRKINLDTQVNASASFTHGWRSMFFKKELTLTVGIPLFQGLTVQNLSGVIAHEFGHFQQEGGMMVHYLIWKINAWFERVVYERDEFDYKLEETAANTDIRIAIILHLARLMIWLTRRILWVLMMIARICTGFLSRQMEYDADTCEILLAGSEDFKEVSDKIFLMMGGFTMAIDDVTKTWQEQAELADDWGKLVIANVTSMEKDLVEKALKEKNSAPTRLFDTHPSDSCRITRAVEFNAEPKLLADFSPTYFFSNFDVVSKGLTLELYRDVYRIEIRPDQLKDTDLLLKEKQEAIELGKVQRRFYQDGLSILRDIKLPDSFPGLEQAAESLLEIITQTRKEVFQGREKYDKDHKLLDQLTDDAVKAKHAEILLKANFSIRAGEFGLAKASFAGVNAKKAEIAEKRVKIENDLNQFESAIRNRLLCNLQLLNFPELDLNNRNEQKQEAIDLWGVVNFLKVSLKEVHILTISFSAIQVVLFNLEHGDETSFTVFQKEHNAFRMEITNFLRKANIPYPFYHNIKGIDISSYLCKELPPSENIQAAFDAYASFFDNFYSLYYRVFAKLAMIAETVENAVGFDLLPMPPDPPAPASESDK